MTPGRHCFLDAPARFLPLIASRCLAGVLTAQQAPYDLLLKNGRIVDGTGSPWYRADVGIKGDTIAAIAPRLDGAAARAIDVRAPIVAPGFIDIHTHARRGITQTPTARQLRAAGRDDGHRRAGRLVAAAARAVPRADWTRCRSRSTSAASSARARSGRRSIGNVNRKATAEEIEKMQALVEQGMKDGALRPEHRPLLRARHVHADRGSDRAREGRRPLRRHPHVASARRRVEAARQRAARRSRSARRAACRRRSPTQGHRRGQLGQERRHAAAGRRGARPRRGRHDRSVSLHRVEHEHRVGAASGLGARRRPQAQLARLKDPATREKIKAEIVAMIRDERGGGDPKNVQFANCGFDATLAGKTLADVTRKRGLDADDRERRRDDDVDRRAGRLPGHLPRDERGRPGPHPAASGDDDRVGRRGADLRPRQSASAQLRHVRARARRLRAREAAC